MKVEKLFEGRLNEKECLLILIIVVIVSGIVCFISALLYAGFITVDTALYDRYIRSDVCDVDDVVFHKRAHQYDNISELLELSNWIFSKKNVDSVHVGENRQMYKMGLEFMITCAQIDLDEKTRILIRRSSFIKFRESMIVQSYYHKNLPNCGDIGRNSFGTGLLSEFLTTFNSTTFLDMLAEKKFAGK